MSETRVLSNRFVQFQSATAALLRSSDRFVSPRVTDPEERERQNRLIKLLLFGPFFFVAMLMATAAGQVSHASILAIACSGLAIPWMAAGALSSTGRQRPVSVVALAAACTGVAILISLGGGIASPLMMLAFALPAESYWVTRNWQSAIAGLVAAVAAVTVQFLLPPLSDTVRSGHWFVPFAYYVVLVWRAQPPLAAAARIASSGDLRNVQIMNAMNAVTIDFGTGNDVLHASGKVRKLLNVDGPFLLGNGLFNRIHVGDRVSYLSALSGIRNGADVAPVCLRVRVPSEDENQPDRFAEFSAEFVCLSEDGKDISAILRPAPEVQNLRAELKETSEKASSNEIAKSRFLAAVSHELRTPLNAIIGFSDILLHEMFGKFSSDKQREYVDLVRQSGRHLLSVVNAILDVSKIESGTYAINPEPFDFKDSVSMCTAMLRHQADEKRVTINDRVSPGLEKVRADPRAVQQILINLISNAVKFTPPGGEVTISAQTRNDRLELTVADTGIGIASQDIEQLGKPFVQVQNEYTRNFEGTGLGLSLVKGLVELHEGELNIDSEPERGTLVTVCLPVSGPSSKTARLPNVKDEHKEPAAKNYADPNRRSA